MFLPLLRLLRDLRETPFRPSRKPDGPYPVAANLRAQPKDPIAVREESPRKHDGQNVYGGFRHPRLVRAFGKRLGEE